MALMAFNSRVKRFNARGGKGGAEKKPITKAKEPKTQDKQPAPEPQIKAKPKKLSYKYERELNQLPDKIEAVEKEIAGYSEKLADTDFYQRDPNGFHDVTKSLSEAEAKRERYENRWLELEEMKMETEQARG